MWEFEVPVILLVNWQCGKNIVSLVHTQPPIQWLLGAFAAEVKWQNMKMASHLRVLPRFRKSGAVSLLPHLRS